jgi:hypothetical protein
MAAHQTRRPSPQKIRKLQKQREKKSLPGVPARGVAIPQRVEWPAGIPKMSEVLSQFAEPWMRFVNTEVGFGNVVAFAMAAWNAALAPEEAHSRLIDQAIATIPSPSPEAAAGLCRIMQEMIAHKRMNYAADKRLIIDVKIRKSGDKFDLSVVSGMFLDDRE